MLLSINKTYCWIFVIAFTLLVPSIHLVKFLDELMVLVMMCLVMLDVLVNRNYKKYSFLFAVMGIMALYFIYSLFLPYNTPKSFVYDYIAQMKPYCYFGVAYAIVPRLNAVQKYVLKKISLINGILSLVLFVTGFYEVVFFHISLIGHVTAVSFMMYMLTSVKDDGTLAKKDYVIAILILTIGLTCTRAKFYGEYIMAIYMLFIYRPTMLKKIKLSHILLLAFFVGIILVVAWGKIDYYFISGGEDVAYDSTAMESFARPLLYISMIMILMMHPVLGSGLASYASHASSSNINYSGLYYVLGLDDIWGLSPDYDAFICDAFYPSLAQFGVVGIVLFIGFFVWCYKRMKLNQQINGKIHFTIGIMSIIVLLIESIAATTFCQGVGGICMMMLGYEMSMVKNVKKEKNILIEEK